MRTPEQKAKRSRSLAQYLGIFAGSYAGVTLVTSLTGWPVSATVTAAALAITLTVLSALAFRAARRWQELADSQGLM